MLATTSALLGGIGLFLVGMILMTDGLKGAAGTSLQKRLGGLTKGPGQAMAAGAGVTALVQSSSATTVATIGFVSAGMLTFPQALGIIMGANLGTTSTGWIVAGLGLKLSIGAVALPLVGVGALLRLLTSGRRAQVGMALAGFGLIFVGIDALQEGMAGMADRFDPESFPSPERVVGQLLLVLLGAVTTVVMQSSSAAVATTLTALHAGTLDLPQATYLIVGQNVGTTVTAALAAVGASVPARRTALAHILFNLGTGLVALILLPWVLPYLIGWAGGFAQGDLTLVIAGFHTVFNVLGVVIFFPGVEFFSRVVTRIIPDRGPELTRNLDRSMLEIPSVALEAARRALRQVAARLVGGAADRLRDGRTGPDGPESDLSIDEALNRIQEFLGSLETASEGPEEFHAHVSLLHATDHIDRLVDVVRETADPTLGPESREAADRLEGVLESAATWLEEGGDGEGAALTSRLAEVSSEIAEERRRQRVQILENTARQGVAPEVAEDRLHAMRWVDRLAYHTWRIAHHLSFLPLAQGGRAEVGGGRVVSEDARMEGAA